MPGVGIGIPVVNVLGNKPLPTASQLEAVAFSSDIIFKSSATATVSGPTLTCNKPSGTVVGDVLVATWATRADVLDADMDLPADWVQVAYLDANTPTVKMAYKVCGASEPATYDFVMASSVAHSVSIERYIGVDITNPSDVAASTNSGTSGTTLTALSIAPVTPGAMLIAFFANHTITGTAITDPVDMIERAAITAQCRNTVSELLLENAGATGDKTATQATSARWTAILWALRPAVVAANVTATVSPTSYRTAVTKTVNTIVDNNMIFAGATTQKAAAIANLAGKFHHLNMFAESFGNADNMLNTWDGVSDAISALPQPDIDLLLSHIDTLEEGITPDTWGIYDYRRPWQFTGVTTDAGVTTKSVSGDYSNDGRRLLTNKRAQYVEHTARWSATWFGRSTKNRRVYKGSEEKSFQSVIQVVVDGVTIRANRNQSWDWDDYEGTPGRADMGSFAYYLALREGLMLGAQRAGVPWSEIKIVLPYPVISHQGDAGPGTGQADAIKSDTFTDSTGLVIDVSDINGDGSYPGYPNKAAIELIIEQVRLLVVHSIPLSEIVIGFDFGSFNEDGVPTPGTTDHDLSYRRVKGMMAFIKKLLIQHGFDITQVEFDFPEKYFKAQYEMDQGDEHAIEESLRDDYQASIDFAGMIACYEEGVHSPCEWSPWGRGKQSTTANDQNDPNQWYGGMLVRTVTDNNDHAGSAVPGGGEPQALLAIYDAFKTHFPPGTPLHAVTLSDNRMMAMASDEVIAVQNITGDTLTFSVNNAPQVSFSPYQFQALNL